MLRFVLGRSGYGKSEYLKDVFSGLAKDGGDKLLFIVPDQISFETETAFLDRLGPMVAQRIKVLGFSRLCDYVFEATGNRFAAFADDGIRSMVMSLALEQVGDSLTVFDKRRDAADVREMMLSAIKEYKKCALSADDLRAAAERVEDDTLMGKLNDTALVYDAYNALMERSYMDPLDSLTKVSKLLSQHRLFEGYTIALDAFYGFTAQEYDVIEQLMAQAGEIYVALTDDGIDDGGNLFYVPRRTRSRLQRMARSMDIAIAPYVCMDTPRRFKNEALIRTEENVYRITKEPFTEQTDAVTVYRASGIYDECDFVARTIRKLIMDGYRYRDIAVIARESDTYAGVLDVSFEKYAIAYFMDEPEHIDSLPPVRLVNAAFDAVNRGFEREAVLTLLKTGLCGYSVGEIADFENYLFVWDINRKGFFEPFTAPPSGFSDEMTEDEQAQLGRIEALRADIIGKLRRFAAAVKDADGRTIAKALMKLLYDLGCDGHIGTLCDSLERSGEDALAAEMVRMWNALCEILDKTVAVIGDYRVSAKRFAELLYTNFADSQIADIPRGPDEVDVTTADRTLISDKKIVFIIGAVEGVFPHAPVEAGVFTDDERVRLKNSLGLPLSDSIEELIATERYYAYSAITAASEKLFVSYPAVDLRSEANLASDIIGELDITLSGLRFINYDMVAIEDRLLCERAAFDWLIGHYRSRSPQIEALKRYFREKEGYRDILASVDDTLSRHARRITDPELPKRLFGRQMGLSSTRIDVYHKCPFRYFCEYGLRIRERRRAAVDALEYGTLLHHIFETFFGSYQREEYLMMDEAAVRETASDILLDYTNRHFGGTEGKSARFLYLLSRIQNNAVKLILHIIEELRESDFVPVDFELNVGEDIPAHTVMLRDGLSLSVRGSVDRVDRCDADGVSYIRVVDYKTGTKTFNISDILYGLNLQMFIYLYAIQSHGSQRYGEIIPAGVLYMPAVSPTVSADPDADTGEIRKELQKKFTMKGVILNDIDVVTHMEHDGKGIYIPAKIKDGAVSASVGSLATLEEMGAIFRHVDTLVKQMAESLYDGDVDALPLKGGKYDGCAYCAYQSVCLRQEDDACREAGDLSAAEVFDMLKKEVDDDGKELDREPD